MNIWDFFSQEAGQQRRKELDQWIGDNLLGYIPPELDPIINFVSGISPVTSYGNAAAAGQRVMDPSRTAMQRVGDVGSLLSETAGVVAPAVAVKVGAMPLAQAAQESLLGFSSGAQDVGRKVVERLNQPGPMPTLYSNPIMRATNEPVTSGITAYHGSPHDFDKFSMDKIGTGEGAQAYGHGLYFAENADVARGYRDNVFGAAPREMFQSDEAHRIVNDQLQTFGATPNALDGAIDDLRKSLKSAEGRQKIWGDQQPRIDALKEAIGFLENKADTRLMVGNKTVSDVYDSISSRADRLPAKVAEAEYNKMAVLEDLMLDGDVLGVMERARDGAYDPAAQAWFEKEIAPKFKRQGSMYEVNIKANPDDFLDWDKPLSEQTGRVSKLLSDYEALGSPVNYPTGQDWMLEMGRDYFRSGAENPSAEVSAYLSREGIPGIKYLDAMSRGAGEGSRNYVVFDENLISIVKKYGIAGAAAMLGMSQSDVAQAMEAGNAKNGLLAQQPTDADKEAIMRYLGAQGLLR